MALLSFSDVSLFFGSRPIFENLSFQISNREKIGLVVQTAEEKPLFLN